MRVALIYHDPDLGRRRCHHDRLPIYLGRSPTADVPITDAWVSWMHCVIEPQGGVLLVRDLDSKNGTLVNGCRVERSPVMPGDVLTLGGCRVRVEYEASRICPVPPVVYATSSQRGGQYNVGKS